MTQRSTKPGNATLADVASRAGVSAMTVSKVLRGTGKISAKTQKRVKSAVDELNYISNQLAGALRGRTSNIVGVLVPNAGDAVHAEMLSGVNTVLRPLGLRIVVGETDFDPAIEQELVRSFISMRPAGLILNGGVHRLNGTREIMRHHGYPLIQVWDAEASEGTVNIGPSHSAAGRMMAEHFIELGLERIGYIGAELDLDVCAATRARAFTQTCTDNGIDVITVPDDPRGRTDKEGGLLTQKFLALHPDIQGIHYLNDAMAIGGLRVAHQMGLKIPQTIRISGFNGTSIVHSVRTQLTTIDVSRFDIGKAAARALLATIEDTPTDAVQEQDLIFIRGNTS